MNKIPIHLVTYFDESYASRAKVMFDSAMLSQPQATKILYLGGATRIGLEMFPRAVLQSLSDFLLDNDRLKHALKGRSWPEQIFTVGPSFLMEKLQEIPEGTWLVYADSDIWFQIPLEQYMEPFDEANVVLTRHRHYWWNRRRLAKYGEFNVGVIAFRNNVEGRRVLSKWAESCISWCKDHPENGKYADQKYLESFSLWGEGVVIDERIGANLAPWNSSMLSVLRLEDRLLVGGEQPLFFHMQGLRKFLGRWLLGHFAYYSLVGPGLKNNIYRPYVEMLEIAQSALPLEVLPASVRKSSSRWKQLLRTSTGLLLVALLQSIKTEQRRSH